MKKRKGIILAGGKGTRLYPTTRSISKQLLPIYDKPMIYYPMSALMLAGINEILIISTPQDYDSFKRLLGNGSNLGLNLQYAIQETPNGLAQALVIGEEFIGHDDICLILGDNFLFGHGLGDMLSSISQHSGCTIFGYHVDNPSAFGVVEFNNNKEIVSIEEKPVLPKSNYAIAGLYFFDNGAVQVAKNVNLSQRGEYEITSVIEYYFDNKKLNLSLFPRGYTWLDTGTPDNLLEAATFVHIMEKRQGYKIACLEEISYNNSWLSTQKLKEIIQKNPCNQYNQYLELLIKQ